MLKNTAAARARFPKDTSNAVFINNAPELPVPALELSGRDSMEGDSVSSEELLKNLAVAK
jgi:hypothetical protein